ncbi:MAG TPA: FecR domain-containing protein [Candidatus Limnocylindria bacterium]|nr:FecR domain-containing protein [Candidatus Limnocylindria bacterium]
MALCAAIVLSLFAAGSGASAQSALLDALSSRVTLARGGVVDLVTVERVIHSGDTVATDETGNAVITYPDGSTAVLAENSELTVEFVRTTAGDTVVRMQQTLGRVWYAVARTLGSGGRYEVRSPGMASVIRAGSGSYVAVTDTGATTVVATEGTVETSAGGTVVAVPAGASTTVAGPGSTPAPPELAPVPAAPWVAPSPQVAQTAPPTQPAISTPTPTPTAAPTAPIVFEPPTATLPPLPVAATPKSTTTVVSGATATLVDVSRFVAPVRQVTPTPTPRAAPTPAPTRQKDRFGPRKDAPGPPPDKLRKD